jgi:ATP-binding cassette, subfamily C (CFTR/MRP), member 10
LEKLFVSGVPGFIACLSLLGLTMLIKKKFDGDDVENYEVFFQCSQLFTWVRALLPL